MIWYESYSWQNIIYAEITLYIFLKNMYEEKLKNDIFTWKFFYLIILLLNDFTFILWLKLLND